MGAPGRVTTRVGMMWATVPGPLEEPDERRRACSRGGAVMSADVLVPAEAQL